jgi:cell fate (sporulation/competence/biofilm development) regulator YlbF (YheA/YmcA/DUF963 family)
MSIDTDAGVEESAEDVADVEALGQELGEAIRELPEYEAFEEAREAVEESEQAQQRIEEFEQLRQEFQLARQTGDASQEDLQELQQAQRELHQLPAMSEYLEAQERLDARLEAVNEAISDPLAVDFGEEAGGCCQD